MEFSPVYLDSLNEALLQGVWLVMILRLVSQGDITYLHQPVSNAVVSNDHQECKCFYKE
jgi:hypothetical protein